MDNNINNLIDEMFIKFSSEIRSLSPNEKKMAIEKLELAFDKAVSHQKSFWPAVEIGQHYEGIYGINETDKPQCG